MPKFRKRPVVIEAIRWTGDLTAIESLLAKSKTPEVEQELSDPALYIPTLEGRMRADVGDFIVLGTAGELYPVKPEIFVITYEPVDPA